MVRALNILGLLQRPKRPIQLPLTGQRRVGDWRRRNDINRKRLGRTQARCAVVATITARLFVEGAAGIQENCPLIGLIDAEGGAPAPRLKNSVCGGLPLSEAWAVKFTDLPRTSVRLVIGARTGAVFDT